MSASTPPPAGLLPYRSEHRSFRDAVHRFVAQEIAPRHAEWENSGHVPREVWKKAGELGFLCPAVPEDYGGAGADFLFSVIVTEELARAGATGPIFYLHSDIVAPYLIHYGTEEQKARWLPRMVSGETITGIAMSEPGGGSDLAALRTRARRDASGGWTLSGQKIFISNGQVGNLFVVAAKTDPALGHKGISLFLVEADRPGFVRGRRLEKIGMHAQDTSELFFDEVKLPAGALLGEEGCGFAYMMSELPQERLMVAIAAVAAAEAGLEWTLEYTRGRNAFGGPLTNLQHVRFELAELKTEVTVGRGFLDSCILHHLKEELDTATASMAKYWLTEMQFQVLDRCVQLFGGYGYMREYPIARAWADARVQRIYGGTTEIMKEVIARWHVDGTRHAG